jgi:hypothetical protein
MQHSKLKKELRSVEEFSEIVWCYSQSAAIPTDLKEGVKFHV